ncbi:MAG: hypothetical protein H0X31_17250 [Nostocaceae cyanobacterium]|nr:hypothetical protein [Nostocaceae cyanobacterium]
MLKLVHHNFNVILSLVLCLSVVFGYPNVAQADKAVQSVLFDPSSTAVSVANIYETTATTQKDVISGVMKSSKSFFKKTPGLNSFSLLKSEDGARVLTLTQWQTPESYQAFIAPPAEESPESSKKEKKGKAAVAPTRTVVFKIDKTQAPEGVIPAVAGKATLVQFSEITAKAPDDQSKLLASAEEMLSGVPQMYPAPQSAVVFQGVDSANLALLASWGYSSAEFADLSKVPTLNPLSDDVAALADSDQHLYEVVNVIAPKAKKEKGSKEE